MVSSKNVAAAILPFIGSFFDRGNCSRRLVLIGDGGAGGSGTDGGLGWPSTPLSSLGPRALSLLGGISASVLLRSPPSCRRYLGA